MARIEKLLTQLKIPSSLDPITTAWTQEAGINFFLKRDDTIHPHICGNKWRKLKYSIVEALESGKNGFITYGGAYSNHLVATSAAASFLGLESAGIIRSYQSELDNPSLDICRSYGMKLYFIHPNAYKNKSKSQEIKDILARHPDFQLIPEGGTQESALKGVGEVFTEIENDIEKKAIDVIYTPIGTGGTMAGLAMEAKDNNRIIGISPFKGDVNKLAGIDLLIKTGLKNWTIERDTLGLRFGAYSVEIVKCLVDFYESYDILLDPVYTVRCLLKVQMDVEQGRWKEGSNVVMMHTGGLQGCRAYNHQYANKDILIPESILEKSIT